MRIILNITSITLQGIIKMKKMILISAFSFTLIMADDFVEYGPSFGGYGEMHYNVEGESLDFHRFVLFFNNQFDDN